MSDEDLERKKDYFELCEQAQERNWKDGAAEMKFKEAYNEMPPVKWQLEWRRTRRAA